MRVNSRCYTCITVFATCNAIMHASQSGLAAVGAPAVQLLCAFSTAEPDISYVACTAAAAQAMLTRTVNIAFAVMQSHGCQHTQHLCMDTTPLLESLATTAVALLQTLTCC